MRISFIIPSRNNLKYLQQAVGSIEKCYGGDHDIILLDDASTDGTWAWIQALEGSNFIKYRNEDTDRVGHTVLYDMGVALCKTPAFSILHADMVVTEHYVKNMLKHLKPLTVVCATRIEPPLHPPGPEKIVQNLGLEPEQFSYENLTMLVTDLEQKYKNQTTKGIFAPWCMYKEDFTSIGGHDKLFAPMELEDSDIFNRMLLAGYSLVQSRDAFVYHMTCRGSRFKDGLEIEAEIPLPDGTIWYKPKDSEEYKALRQHKFREWWRKWHTDVLHDKDMMPIVPGTYSTKFVVENCSYPYIQLLEPWCDFLTIDPQFKPDLDKYIQEEKSMFDLSKKVSAEIKPYMSVVVLFDAARLTQDHFSNFIAKLPEILDTVEEPGVYEYEIFTLNVLELQKKDMIQPIFKNVF